MEHMDAYSDGPGLDTTSQALAAEYIFNCVLKRLYDTSTKMLRTSYDLDLWKRYYAHVMFHDFKCAECPDCIAMTCARGCVAAEPDFDARLEENVRDVCRLHDAYFAQTMRAVDEYGRELEKNNSDADDEDSDDELCAISDALGRAKLL
jgi:hypothetical protein